jgi:hypothetical protein
MNKIASEALDKLFDEVYVDWGGDKKLDDQVATELLVPVFAGERLKMLVKKVNAIMGRQEELPLDNVWRVEIRENARVVLDDFTLPSSSVIMRKIIKLIDAPKFIQDGVSVLQIAPDGTSIEGVGKKISEDVYYIVESNDGKHPREEGKR